MIRKLLFCACMMMAVSGARSQVYIDGQNINADTSVQLIEIVYETYTWNFNVRSIDVGARKSGRFTDASGKRIILQSPVDMINYMKRNGWHLLRRDMVFHSKPESSVSTTTLGFVIFERISTVPAH